MWLVGLGLMLALLAFCSSANADFTYDFQFGALTYNGVNYAADEFSLTSPALLGPGPNIIAGSPFIDYVSINPPVSLNGLSISEVYAGLELSGMPPSLSNMGAIGFYSPPIANPTLGQLTMFMATIVLGPGAYGPGTYYTSDSFYRVFWIDGSYQAQGGSGTLIICENVVPVPPTLFLLGSGLLSMAGWRRFRKG